MSKLTSAIAAVAIAGATMIGGSALAADAATGPELNDDHKFAISVVKEFSTCVGNAMPAYQQAMQDYQMTDGEWHAKHDAEYQKIVAPIQLKAQQPGADMDALQAEFEAALTAAGIPAHPTEPANPQIACQDAAGATITAAGKTFDDVNNAMQSAAGIIGQDELMKLVTPAP